MNDGLRVRLRHLPVPLAASGVLLVGGAVLGGVLRGPAGALGAVAGVLLVAASYVVSTFSVMLADRKDPRLVLPVGLACYAGKIALLGVVMAAVSATGWHGLVPMGSAIVVTALTWIAAQLVWTVRARIPYVDVPLPARPDTDD